MTDLDVGPTMTAPRTFVPELHALPPRVPAPREPMARQVSAEELRLLALLADGLPLETIARRLSLSDRTVRRRSKALCDRMGARAPIQVVAWAARNGLI
jgi:DNA-binding NarL/FixJ family response regulator